MNLLEREMRWVLQTTLMEALLSARHQIRAEDCEFPDLAVMILRIQGERG